MLGFNSFDQIDLLGANKWSDGCLSYDKDWMPQFNTEQPYLASDKGESGIQAKIIGTS